MTQARILIVEDDELVAQDTALRIQELGYAVVGIVASGEDVLLQWPSLKPDLILMDVLLAGLIDGIETARQIRRCCDVPVIFLTSHDNDDLVKRAISTGAYAYLQKPLKPGELKLTLELTLYRFHMETRLKETLSEMDRYCSVMKESEARFRAVFEEAPIGIVFAHPDGRFFKFNRAFCGFVGFSRAELLDRDFLAIAHPADCDRYRALAAQVLAGETQSLHMEMRFLNKAGQEIWGNLIASLIRNPEGQPIYWLAMIENISCRKQGGVDVFSQ